MDSIYKNSKTIFSLVVGTGVLLASVFLLPLIADAQTANDSKVQSAIDDLSSVIGQDITTEDQARALCNQEQYWETCADIGKKHDLYTPEEVKHVNDFLGEVKGKVLNDIKTCPDEECLVKVANELAQKLQAKNPGLAASFDLTAKIIEEKNSVVQAAKEVGVSFRDCETMNPDTAPIDLLRKCARLAKDSRVQNYIPEERRILAEQFEDSATIKLREALSIGKYQCGDNTLEGCGNFCLNPTQGTGIPPVCAQIASEIFGKEGVKQLEAAHQQVGQVKDYYSNKFVLTLPDGSKFVGEKQIRERCDRAFSNRNLEVARACGSFAINNGFAAQSEVDKGLKLMESFTQKSGNVNFDQCLTNPASCREFLPEDEKGRFDAGSQIFEIMRTEIGFDPSQCERGATDEAIGMRCFEGAKRALAKIEGLGLAGQSREARFIIEDIKRHVSEGENMTQKKDEFKQVFSQQGGPGGCRSEAECFTYCSDPNNGPECISFGAKQGISGFRGEESIQRFQEYNQNVQKSSDVTSNEYRAYPSDGRYPQFPGQGPYPGFQPGYVPPGQFPGFTQPGPGFSPPPGQPYYPGPGPIGPSPECFAAIQSGDFVKAKAVCEVNLPQQPYPSVQVCPVSAYFECPAGQYHDESFRNSDGCWVIGACKSAPTYSPYPTYTGGPYPTYSPGSGNGWINKTWKFKDGYTQSSSILNRTDGEYTSHINSVYDNCLTKYFAGWKPGGGDQSNWREFGIPVCSDTKSTFPSPYPTYSSGPYPTYTYSPYPSATGGAGGMYSCFYPNATKNGTSPGYTIWCEKDYFNCHEGSKTGPSISLDGLSLGAPSSCESGWPTTTYTPYPTYSSYPTPGSCPSGYHYHGESGGFCMNDQENYGGTCYNSAGTSKISCPVQPTYSPGPGSSSCSSSLVNLLGTGCHWMYSDSSGRGIFCDGPMSKSAKEGDTVTTAGCSGGGTYSPYPTYTYTYTPSPSCPSGQWWDYSTSSCKSTTVNDSPYPTSTYTYTPSPSCPSGQWWDYSTSSCKSTTVSDSPYPTSTYTYTPPPSCSSDQYWDGSACVTNPTPYPTYSESPPPTSMMYNSYMLAHCQQLGRTWNGSRCQANGLFARFYEYGLANILRFFYVIP
ncbi:MAG: hypothetical protein HYW77_03180 [Parcubacteria group bacterium]|nr:hypothetical protein [Parcubacteria group bacterium]